MVAEATTGGHADASLANGRQPALNIHQGLADAESLNTPVDFFHLIHNYFLE